MNKLNKSFEVALLRGLKRRLILRKPYFEFLKDFNRTGGNRWAEFKVNLIPKIEEEPKISVLVFAEHDLALDSAVKGIAEGIKKFIYDCETKGIELHGFSITIENHSYHPVDSKPMAFYYPLLEMMRKLTSSDAFKKEILSVEDLNKFFEIQQLESTKRYYQFSNPHIQIDLPKKNDDTLVFTHPFHVSIFHIEPSIKQFEIEIQPVYQLHKQNHINIRFENLSIPKSSMFEFVNQLNEFRDIIYNKGVNLGGLDISINSSCKWLDRPFSKAEIYENALLWALLNIIEVENNFELEDENRVTLK